MELTKYEAALSAGTIDYWQNRTEGPALVLCHGLLMNHTVWKPVVDQLSDVRVVLPDLPLGGHRTPLKSDVDVTFSRLVDLFAEFVVEVGLTDIVLVVSDTSFPLSLAADRPDLVRGLVLLPAELYGNIPPGLPGKTAAIAARVPGGMRLAVASLRVPGAVRLPMTFGRMVESPTRALADQWLSGFRASAGVRRDVVSYSRATDYHLLGGVVQRLSHFPGPVRVLWARDDEVMPFAHAERLVRELPDAHLTAVDHGHPLLQLEQPELVAATISELAERRA